MCQICRLHFFFDAAIIKQKDARFQTRRPKGASRESGEPPFFPGDRVPCHRAG